MYVGPAGGLKLDSGIHKIYIKFLHVVVGASLYWATSRPPWATAAVRPAK